MLDEYKVWPATWTTIIISNTTSSTGKSVGAVTQLQKNFVTLGFDKPLYIGWRHHVLETIQMMNHYFVGATTSHNLNYWFISEITEGYEQLKGSFDDSGNVCWRDGNGEMMAFLHYLVPVQFQFKAQIFTSIVQKPIRLYFSLKNLTRVDTYHWYFLDFLKNFVENNIVIRF